MKIISSNKTSISHVEDYETVIHCIHVKILTPKKRTAAIIAEISDTTWINELDAVEKASYAARAKQTVSKLVNEILDQTASTVTEELGEYLVSGSAREALCDQCNHNILPLAELWKEKISGNPGFDFHTETPTKFIAFGEAKYRSKGNAHTIAIEQIVGFIEDGKDVMELVDLKNFASKEATKNALKNKKAFVAAFSINGKSYDRIFSNAINSEVMKSLHSYPELYLIGIEL